MIQLKCPICGKPVPHSKGVKPRKFCSHKCSNMAAHISARNRGYKRPKSHRKVCPICGEAFFADREKTVYCSHECANSGNALKRTGKVGAKAKERIARCEQKRRELECCKETAQITVEYRGHVRIETRGQRCIGAFAANNHTHL